jgi:prepilin-type N-terminal cleavage/methylation domain-containing protein
MRRQLGFTLVELMIVVTIIGVLAVVAGTAYRRYMDAGRTAEAYAMFGEIRNREEAYRAEFSTYAQTGASEANYFPLVDGSCSEPCAKPVSPLPASWDGSKQGGLGINPGKSSLYCGYVVQSGAPGTAPTGALGTQLIGNVAINTPWWYAIAICDNDGNPATNATFVTAFNTTLVTTQNEHK